MQHLHASTALSTKTENPQDADDTKKEDKGGSMRVASRNFSVDKRRCLGRAPYAHAPWHVESDFLVRRSGKP
ncbi:hypothetical protein CALVIDRAFT_537833 [Calocera viscosa TUFC12733]|uniref:Uncharacterized protein n=1 Tax=Calocera viscosa (strain TUFC12733) TaxID=1330018 RepID=A0A167LMU3_CALVF|nr:hypothetical protein CALVIDRAFT_537833 [Calocera viscosa TUFC12733]